MLATINKLYDTVRKDKNGSELVSALFFWDGKDRRVSVPAGRYKVGDKITVSLEEYYNREKKQGSMWWAWKGDAE